MAYHQHLHQAFLDAHGAAGNLAGTWRNPHFGGDIDERMLERIRNDLLNAANCIDDQMALMALKAERAA